MMETVRWIAQHATQNADPADGRLPRDPTVDGARRGAHPYAREVRWLLLRSSVAVQRGNARSLRAWRLHCLKNSEAVARGVVWSNVKQNKHKAKPAATAAVGAGNSDKSSTRQGGGSTRLGGAAS